MTDATSGEQGKVFTLTDIREAVQRVIEKHGRGFIYPGGSGSCFYVGSAHPDFPRSALSENSPQLKRLDASEAGRKVGCIVGEVLTDLGLMTPTVAGYFGSIGMLNYDVKFPIENIAVCYLGYLQLRQDNRLSWGEAVELTEQWMKNGHPDSEDFIIF